MVSKIEIEEEMNEKIKVSKEELVILEKQHKKFNKEHEEDKKREEEYDEISELRDALLSKKWEGNFGDRDNRYYGRIPYKFSFNKEDKKEIKQALVEISNEKEKEITGTEKYQKLKKKENDVCFSKFSKEHRKLDDKIERVNDTISWSQAKILRIQDRGELIQECKRRRKDEIMEEKRKAKDEKIRKYKQMILDINKLNDVKNVKRETE